MLTKKGTTNISPFSCILCDFNTSHKSKFERHLLTRKHKMLTFSSQKRQEEEYYDQQNKIQEDRLYICSCGKKYKHRQSLSLHRKKCIDSSKSNETSNITNNDNLHSLILKIIQENQEIKNSIIKEHDEIVRQNRELKTQLTELIPHLGSNITNNQTNNQINNQTTNQTNNFNIQLFLNEECKDAINMSDFIDTIIVNQEQLDYTRQQGLEQGLTKTILENMNRLSIYERPLHCTDVKRETLYIKDHDEWTKDKTKEQIKTALQKTSMKNYHALKYWLDDNPDYIDNERKSDYFARTVLALGRPLDKIDNKVIKTLCRETYVKNRIE